MDLYLNQRRSIRLPDYDYSQGGYYFVTVCTKGQECLFGKIIDGEMILNNAGGMVKNEWKKLIDRFRNLQLKEFVIMPNHFHGIMKIQNIGVGVPSAG